MHHASVIKGWEGAVYIKFKVTNNGLGKNCKGIQFCINKSAEESHHITPCLIGTVKTARGMINYVPNLNRKDQT